MQLLDAFDTALAEFDHRVHRVADRQWSARTPCEEWTVRDLVNHLTGEHLWAPSLLRGATLDEVGDRFEGDVLGDDPVPSWERAASESQAGFHRPGALDGMVHTSVGETPATEYGWQMTLDLAVHAWDLARGIDDDDRLDEDLVHTVYEHFVPLVDAWQDLGLFDPPVPVPRDVSAQDRLVALLGRRP